MSGERTLVRPRPAPEADAPTHPRMRARRAEVARRAGLTRLRRVRRVLAVVCVVVWALVALRSSLVDVDRVQVAGARQTPASAVQAAAGIAPGTPMVQADLDAAVDGVEALPWVAEARATRLWPGTVRVVVTERTPVAAVAHPDGWATLDGDGRVLAVTPDAPALPALAGERSAGPGERLAADDRTALEVVDALPAPFSAAVVEVGDGADGLELALDDGFRAVFGDASEARAKADAAEAVRQHAPAGDAACRIDVRVPSAPVLTPGRGCA